MPGYDGTGPMGRGSMTGRGMGYCAVPLNETSRPQANIPQQYPAAPMGRGFRNYPGMGQGLGRGRGFGAGRGRGGGRGRRGGGRRW